MKGAKKSVSKSVKAFEGNPNQKSVASRDVTVSQHVAFRQHLRVPGGEIILLRNIDTDQRGALNLALLANRLLGLCGILFFRHCQSRIKVKRWIDVMAD